MDQCNPENPLTQHLLDTYFFTLHNRYANQLQESTEVMHPKQPLCTLPTPGIHGGYAPCTTILHLTNYKNPWRSCTQNKHFAPYPLQVCMEILRLAQLLCSRLTTAIDRDHAPERIIMQVKTATEIVHPEQLCCAVLT